MRKKILAPLLSLALCLSLLPTAQAAGKTYDQAVKELQSDAYYKTEQSFDSDYGTVFIYSLGNTPHGAHGFLCFITKAPCAKGEGEVIGLPHARHSLWCNTKPPLTAELSEDGKTFTYTYHYDDPVLSGVDVMLRPAGDFVYTLDLTTGEVTSQEPSIPEDYNTYPAAMERLKNEDGWVIEQTLEAPDCTVLLRYFQASDGRRSYFLDCVYKVAQQSYREGMVVSHNLTITKNDGTGEPGFPVYYTHRAPDTLELNEDKTLLTYTYSESLNGGADSETLELATGLSSKFNTLPTITPEEAQSPTADFTDVPAGSWLEQGVTTCAQEGVMVGLGDGTFSPTSELTAAECLTFALRLYDLRRGGDGTLETAPEDWGKLELALSDGTTFTRYGYYNPFFSESWFSGPDGIDVRHLYVQAPGETTEEREAWAEAHQGKGTVRAYGKDYPGTLTPDSNYYGPLLRFDFDTPNDGGLDITDLIDTTRPGPDKWFRNTIYTAEAWGLRDKPGFETLTRWCYGNSREAGGWCNRGLFAQTLSIAAGDLEKRYTVERIPDLERNESSEAIYGLYEAGILNGMDKTGTFYADKSLTRAEAAVMVARILDESQRLTEAPTAPNAYDLAVAELRTSLTYISDSERTFETDDCTIFVYDRGGAMWTGPGNITIIYKPGSQPGAGTRIEAERPYPMRTYVTGADSVQLSEDKKSLIYTYHLDSSVGDPVQETGVYTYTVDLPTGTITSSYSPFSYENLTYLLANKRNYTLEQRLEVPTCTVLLRWKPLHLYDDTRDYELWLSYKDPRAEETTQKLLLPSTVLRNSGYGYYKPTDRAPDSLELNEDGSVLTYIYHFDEALEDCHDAGTYTYTVDLTTGELSVTHTAD